MTTRTAHADRTPVIVTARGHRQPSDESDAVDHPRAAAPRAPAAWMTVAEQAGDRRRNQLIAGLQQVHGNAHVARLIVQRTEDGETPAFALQPILLALLMPGHADPDDLIDRIDGAPVADRRAAYHNDSLRGLIMGQVSGSDRERVMAALLSGVTYHPGSLSILYQELSAPERHGIDTAANARFLVETGIGRPLDWGNTADKPLARRWLQLRDQVMDEVIGRPTREKDYEEYLREAIDLLRGAAFGRATGDYSGEDLGNRYDLDYWEEEQDVEVKEQTGDDLGMLRLKPGVSPSLAIDELFAKLDLWAFDCAEFVQVAHLYAQRHTMGSPAFDQMLTDDAGKATLLLRSHGSTNLWSKVLYQRNGPQEPMRDFYTNQEVDKTIDELLAEVPVGSRITWRNLAADAKSDYFNENAIKLGDDQFAAHGLHSADDLGPLNSNVYSRNELELALARITWPFGGDPDQTEIDANVFIRSIQHYLVP